MLLQRCPSFRWRFHHYPLVVSNIGVSWRWMMWWWCSRGLWLNHIPFSLWFKCWLKLLVVDLLRLKVKILVPQSRVSSNHKVILHRLLSLSWRGHAFLAEILVEVLRGTCTIHKITNTLVSDRSTCCKHNFSVNNCIVSSPNSIRWCVFLLAIVWLWIIVLPF